MAGHYLDHVNNFDDPDLPELIADPSLWSARFGALMLDNVPLRAGIAMLDVGCGAGFPLFELANLCGPQGHVTGIDPWKPGIDLARWRLEHYGLSNVTLVEGDASAMPFESESFDLIVSNVGVNNFADAPAVLRDCYRVARPGALMAITSNVMGHMGELYAVFREVLNRLGKTSYLEPLAHQEAHRGTRQSLEALFTGAGFAVGKVIEEPFTLRYLSGTAFFNHWFIKMGFLDGWKGAIDGPDQREIFEAVEARLNAIAKEQGELRFTVPMIYMESLKP
jgi:ubiquinone/menaquinone biosynthesis C-methylase UbiE